MPTATLYPTRPLRPSDVGWFLADPLRTAIAWEEDVRWPGRARAYLAQVAGLDHPCMSQPILNEWEDLL